jgi:hypothetical protein
LGSAGLHGLQLHGVTPEKLKIHVLVSDREPGGERRRLLLFQ